jgi:hypothetical protein
VLVIKATLKYYNTEHKSNRAGKTGGHLKNYGYAEYHLISTAGVL